VEQTANLLAPFPWPEPKMRRHYLHAPPVAGEGDVERSAWFAPRQGQVNAVDFQDGKFRQYGVPIVPGFALKGGAGDGCQSCSVRQIIQQVATIDVMML